MEVRVRLTGAFREWVGAPEVSLEVPAGATLRDLLAALAARSPRFGQRVGSSLADEAELSDRVLAVAGDRVLRGGDLLPEGIEVSLFPPIHGGAPGWGGP